MGFVGKQDDNLQTPRFGAEPSPLDRRESVAAVLRRERERHNQDVRSVAQVLRIRQAYLEALESGRFDKLPGTAYALGFLRTYAEYLGLNANNIVDRFKEEVQGPERHTELVFPEPVAEARIPGGAIILISVMLLGVAYGGWFYLSNQGRSVADLIPAMPGQAEPLVEGETDAPAKAPAPAPMEPPVVSTEAPVPKAKPAAEAAALDTPAPATPAPATPAPATPEPASAEPAEPAPAVAAVVPAPPPAPAPAPVSAPVTLETPAVAASEPAPEPAPLARPEPSAQIAALPEADGIDDAAGTVIPSPPARAESEPAPAPVYTPNTGSPLTGVPAPAQSPAQSTAGTFSASTVVIPAPPRAPQGFAQPGARAPQVYGASNEDARIVLRAIQDSWVQVRDGQDALLLTRVLRSGDSYRVPDQPGLTLLTGNAGGLALEVDGVRLPPLGPVGSVRRQIALDPAALLKRER